MSPKDGRSRDLAWFGAGVGVVVAAAGRWLVRSGRDKDDDAAAERAEDAVAAPRHDPWDAEPVLETVLGTGPVPEPEPEPEPEVTDEMFVETSLRLTPVVDVPPEWISEVIEVAPAPGDAIDQPSALAEHAPPPLPPPLFADEEPVAVEPEPVVDETLVHAAPLVAPVEETDEPEPVLTAPRPAPVVVPARRPRPDTGPLLPRRPVLELGIGAASAVLGVAAIAGVSWALPALAVIAVVVAGLWILAFHPLLVPAAMAFFLGFAPGVQTPVVGISVTFVLAVGTWVALAVMPDARHRVPWPVGLSAVVVAASLFSVVANPFSVAAVADFVRWALATAVVYPLLALPAVKLARVGRAFVWGCALAAVVGIGFRVLDPTGDRLFSLSVFGYAPDGLNSRYVLSAQGTFLRLTGTYVDPNLGGLIMVVGLTLALALLRGFRRVAVVGVLGVAIALTLSRADAGSVVLAGLLLVTVGRIGARIRTTLIGLGLAAVLGLLSVPAVRERLSNSFGSRDEGSSARWEAIEILPDQMNGHWFFGRGFGAPELVDQAATAATNYVANAPLLAVYRGGVVVGIAFSVLLLAAVVSAWRLLRTRSFERASLGAGFLGLTLVAFQLDIPVVTLTPAILCLSLLLAFLGSPESVDDPAEDTEPELVPARFYLPPPIPEDEELFTRA